MRRPESPRLSAVVSLHAGLLDSLNECAALDRKSLLSVDDACRGNMPIKVLQVPFHYYPDAVGGTEVYASVLSQKLQAFDMSAEIAAPSGTRAFYTHAGIPVHRFGFTTTPTDVSMLYGDGDPKAVREFSEVLDRTEPDLVHLHAMSSAVSLRVVREIKRRRIPVVFTCHIPGVVCSRGTLLRNGSEPCDAVWGLRKCSSCVLESKGLPRLFAVPVASLPESLGCAVGALRAQGPMLTALRTTELQAQRKRVLTRFLDEVDRVIAVSEWLRHVLSEHGVPSSKILLCRHGSTHQARARVQSGRCPSSMLRVAFAGRLNPAKGVHILLEAVRRRPQLAIQLDIFGVIQDDTAYAAALARRAQQDTRIALKPAIPNDGVVEQLAEYDVLAVPSQGMETGPLVVYDAFEAGLPVVGSNRGGIAELVRHERDGLLVEPADVDAWSAAFTRLCEEDGLVQRLRSNVTPGRTMGAVAAEMAVLYRELTAASNASVWALESR